MGSKLAAVAATLVVGSTHVLAGTVRFDPSETDALPGDTLAFEVWVETADFASFNSVGMLIASFDLVMADFAYSNAFLGAITPGTEIPPIPFIPPGWPNRSAINAGGISLFSDSMAAPLPFGTLTVDVPGDVAPGTYEVFVDSGDGGFFSGLTSFGVTEAEPLTGRAMVNVVPEPATIALVGLGAVGLIRRHQSV